MAGDLVLSHVIGCNRCTSQISTQQMWFWHGTTKENDVTAELRTWL